MNFVCKVIQHYYMLSNVKIIFRTIFFGEYGCSGPGANNTYRVPYAKQLSVEEATPFMDISFIDGHEWLSRDISNI